MIRTYAKCILALLLLVVSTMYSLAQITQPALPATYGTRFWVGFLVNNGTKMEDASLKLTIYAVAEEQVTVVVALGKSPGTPLGTISIPAGGGVGSCVVDPKQVYLNANEIETVVDKGVVVFAKDGKTKFTCYAYAEVEGGTGIGSTRDATILLPEELLWKEYFVQTYLDDAKSTEFMVVGTENDTKVTIYPSTSTSKGGTQGNPIDIILDAGQVYLVQSKSKEQSGGVAESVDLSGSMVCSDRPIAVFCGNEFAKIPNDAAYSGNHVFEQALAHVHLGSEFYIGLAGGSTFNKVYITATLDNTTVKIERYNTDTKQKYSKEVRLDAGQSLNSAEELTNDIMDAHIVADKPVVCYSYLTCGAVNQETYYDEQGDRKFYNWGNPTNAMVVPWSHRVTEMSFYTDEIVNQTNAAKQKYFVQLITSAADKDKIMLDGALLDASAFTVMGTDPSKVFANIELTTHGKHRLMTEGDGFVGFVLGMTSEARAYQYTLGFNPPIYYDSLYIENPAQLMSPLSYNLPYINNRGWYQRQLCDWPKDEERLDTAIVCDSTMVDFLGLLPDCNADDSVVWKVYLCEKDKPFDKEEPAVFMEDQSINRTKEHKLRYQFILDAQKNLEASKRDPFRYFRVEMERYKKHIICTEFEPDPDTLRTMVRVNRIYNDTTWRIVCETDTIHFFYDDYNHPGKKAMSIFKFETTDLPNDTVPFYSGPDSITRYYTSVNGCDSIVTLMLWGCDTVVRYKEMTVCQDSIYNLNIRVNNVLRFSPPDFKIIDDARSPYDSIYVDVQKVRSCIVQGGIVFPEASRWVKHCPDFLRSGAGCKDSMTLRLTIMPKSYFPMQDPPLTPWCTGGDKTIRYDEWYRQDGTKVLLQGISQDDFRFDENGEGVFRDTLYWEEPECNDCPIDEMGKKRCIKEIDVLRLRIISNENKADTVHICQNQTYTHMLEWPKGQYIGANMPIGEHIDTCYVEIKDAFGMVLCSYWDTLHLWVHPVYIDTMASMHDYQQVCRTKPFAWSEHTGADEQHQVWDQIRNQYVLAAALPTGTAGEYVFIDSLKTTTCPDCKQGAGCDSIWTLHLTVNPDYIFSQSFTLCDNDTLMWQGRCYYGYRYEGTKPVGSFEVGVAYLDKDYEDTLRFKSQFTCDSLQTLKIRLYPTYFTEIDTAICEGQTYVFFNKEYHFTSQDQPYVLDSIVPSVACNCDSGVIHRVFVHKRYFLQDTDTAYQEIDAKYGGWNSHLLTEDPTRTIWMVDGVRNTKWALHPDSIPLSVPGTFYLWDSLKTKTCQTCFNGPGCDSIFVRQLTILPTYAYEHHQDLSSEETFVWEGKLYAGEYATIPADWTGAVLRLTADTCDTVQYYTTQAIAPFPPSVGTYDKGDSLEILCIRLGKVFRDTLYDATCRNCDYDWTIHPFGVEENDDSKDTIIHIPSSLYPLDRDTLFYDDSLRTMMGFDSIYTLVLSIYPNKLYQDADAMECQGNEFNWHTHPGQREYLYITRNGQTFAIHKDDFSSVITQDSGWVVITDSLLTDSLYIHPETLAEKHIHCDSIWQLNLYVSPTYSEKYNPNDVHFQTTICSNDTVLWNNYLYVGYDFDTVAHPLSKVGHDSIIYVPKDSVASYYDSVPTLGTKNGCDSTNYLRITINPSRFTLLIDSIGDNDETWSFGGKGGTFSYKGKPYITRNDLINSDTIHYDSDKRVVQQFFFIDTLKTNNGCDTIIHDSLWVLPSYRYDFDTTICRNERWSWRPESPNWQRFKDINYQCSGQCTFYDSLLTKPVGLRQLDSVYVLHLTVLPASETWFYPNMCKNDTIEWETLRIHFDQESQSMSPIYKANYANGAGCDSTLLLQPTYYEFYHFDDVAKEDSTCQYVPYHWIEEDGTEHLHALRGEKGEIFDSIPTDSLPSLEGGWITIYDSLHTSSICHCDSTYTLRLYIRPTKFHHLSYTACTSDTVYWIDRISQCVFDTTGYGFDADVDRKYYCDSARKVLDTIAGVTSCGCDSSYYLTIQFNQSYYFHKEDTVCSTHGEYVWNGITIPQEVFDRVHNTTLDLDTVVWDSLQTLQTSCDSLYVLSLKIKPSLTEYITDTICIGERYILNGDTFAIDTVIHQTLTNQFGCDSFLVATLQVVPPTDFKISPVIECADANSYTLHYEFDTLHGYAPHTIRIVYDSLAVAYDFPKDTVEMEIEGNEAEIDLPDATPYLTPNVYSATIFFDNGVCIEPESQRKDFLITIQYPSWVLEQHWSDAICILNRDYNGGYEFNQYQWYKNGDLIPGETKPYLFVPQYLDLDAEYQVLLTRSDDSISVLTCPAELTLRDSSLMPTKPYVSVVPTLVPKAFPYTNILCNEPGSYTIYSPYGVAIQSGRFEPCDHNAYQVKIPAEQGMYLFDLRQENNGEQRSIKVVVQ